MKNTVFINCDHCFWYSEIPWKDIPKWKDKTCPECGAVVVNAYDVKVWKVVNFFVKLRLVKVERPVKGYAIQVNTAPDKSFVTVKDAAKHYDIKVKSQPLPMEVGFVGPYESEFGDGVDEDTE